MNRVLLDTTFLVSASCVFLACSLAACSSETNGAGPSTSSSSSGAGGSGQGGEGQGGGQGGNGGASGVGGSGGSGGAGAASGTIVPLYTYPSDPTWDVIAAAKSAHPKVDVRAIINPNSGAGAAEDPNYTSGIAALSAAGVVVLGYIATTYGARPAAEVEAEMDDYKQWYPGVTGIFLDEMESSAGKEAYYSGLTQSAKSKGFSFTVGNPGTDVEQSYVGTVDTIFIYETDGLPSAAALGGWHAGFDPKNFGVIPYAVPALDASFVGQARPFVGYIYITDDNLPNPWDSLPPYFSELLDALE